MYPGFLLPSHSLPQWTIIAGEIQVQNKTFSIAIAVASLVTVWWLSTSNTNDTSLSEFGQNDPVSPLSKNVKSATTPKIFYSPPPAAKPKPSDTFAIKEPLKKESLKIEPLKIEPLKKVQSESWNEAPIETTRDARLQGDDRLPEEPHTSDELPASEPNSEYDTHQEPELKNDYADATNIEIHAISQQLQAMRDTGTGETALREAEEKLIQLQRSQDQQSISRVEEDNEASL